MQFSAKKFSKNESKMDLNVNTGPAPKRAIRHSCSANQHSPSPDWHKLEVRLEDSWIEINLTLFDFLEMRTHPNSYLILQLIFQSILTSINRGCLSKFRGLFLRFLTPPPPSYWIFSLKSPYIKDVLEAFTLGISFW